MSAYFTRKFMTPNLLHPYSPMVKLISPWWHHQMYTQMEIFSALLAFCEGNPPVTGGYLSQRPVTRSFDVFFDLRLNKRLSKQSRRWWFGTPSRSLERHCNAVTLHRLVPNLSRSVSAEQRRARHHARAIALGRPAPKAPAAPPRLRRDNDEQNTSPKPGKGLWHSSWRHKLILVCLFLGDMIAFMGFSLMAPFFPTEVGYWKLIIAMMPILTSLVAPVLLLWPPGYGRCFQWRQDWHHENLAGFNGHTRPRMIQ